MPKTIDHRRKYYLTIDTETANSLDDPLVYDIGGAVHDKAGNVYESFSFVIYETFVLCADIMESAYYAEKIPNYRAQLADGSRRMVRWLTAKLYIRDLCEEYGITAIIAHNARFDVGAVNTTERYITSSKYRYFLPYGIPVWDQWPKILSVNRKLILSGVLRADISEATANPAQPPKFCIVIFSTPRILSNPIRVLKM